MEEIPRSWFVKKVYGRAPHRYSALQVYEKSIGLCGICGESIDPALRWPNPLCFVCDHVISRGGFDGADILENVQAAHRICNYRKAGKDDRDHAKLRGKEYKQRIAGEGKPVPKLIRQPAVISDILDSASTATGHSVNSIVNAVVAERLIAHYESPRTGDQILSSYNVALNDLTGRWDSASQTLAGFDPSQVNATVANYPENLANLQSIIDKLSGTPEEEAT